MAGGAAEALLEELGALGRLSGPGAAQLAADLDYICNVLAALGVALSPPLLTWQARPHCLVDNSLQCPCRCSPGICCSYIAVSKKSAYLWAAPAHLGDIMGLHRAVIPCTNSKHGCGEHTCQLTDNIIDNMPLGLQG